MFKLLKKVDAVVLPYRKTYCYGTSGVLVNSVQAHKPILVPNIYPFSNVIYKYKFGITFLAENVCDLKKNNFKFFQL